MDEDNSGRERWTEEQRRAHRRVSDELAHTERQLHEMQDLSRKRALSPDEQGRMDDAAAAYVRAAERAVALWETVLGRTDH